MESDKKNESAVSRLPTKNKHATSRIVIILIAAIAIFYIGGWYIVWGTNIWAEAGSIYINLEKGIAIRFNNLYYGMFFKARLFDAPFISVITFGFAWALVGWAVELMFHSEKSD